MSLRIFLKHCPKYALKALAESVIPCLLRMNYIRLKHPVVKLKTIERVHLEMEWLMRESISP